MGAVNNRVKKLIPIFLVFLPVFGFAQGILAVNTLVNNISTFILKPLIFGMFAIATLVFIWGVRGFIGAADDAEARAKGSQQMIWGILGMAIMLGAYALVTIIKNTALVL